MSIKLQQGGLVLELSPEHGGSVLNFYNDKHHLLRPTTAKIPKNWDARDFAAFPMVPFCGRIHGGILHVGGRAIQLPANMPPEPHAIHGFGWQTAWQVDENTASTAALSHTNSETAWPWHYRAKQIFELTENGLNLTLQLTNDGTMPMPAGFGWHPYYPRKNAHITAPTVGVWSPDHPVDLPAELDLRTGRAVKDLNMDHAFDLSAPRHTLRWPSHSIEVTADPVFGKMIAYVPDNEAYFCVEAISHAPGTLNSALPNAITGIKQLAPGETLSGDIHMRIIETA